MDILCRTDSTKSASVKVVYLIFIIFQLGRISTGLPIENFKHASMPKPITTEESRRSLESNNDYVVKFETYIEESRWMDALRGDQEFLNEVLNSLHGSPHDEKRSSRRKHHVKRAAKFVRKIVISCKKRTHHGKRRSKECILEPLDSISLGPFARGRRTRNIGSFRPALTSKSNIRGSSY